MLHDTGTVESIMRNDILELTGAFSLSAPRHPPALRRADRSNASNHRREANLPFRPPPHLFPRRLSPGEPRAHPFSSPHPTLSEEERLVHMKRSHMTRKHRSKHDNTDEGVDAGAPVVKRKPTRTSTVRVGLSADGKASVYVVGRSDSQLDGSTSSGSIATPPLDDARGAGRGTGGVASRRERQRREGEGGRTLEPEPRKTSARVRSLVEYERLRASDVVKRASSKTMEDLLSEEDGTRVRYDTAIERIRGVAVLLEMAGVDDVDGVKRAVADHDLDLLHVDCVNATGTPARCTRRRRTEAWR